MYTFTKIRLKVEEVISVILLALLVGFVFAAAALRWVGISIVWSVDFAQFLFTWVCFIGADLAYYHNKHMGVDLIAGHLHGKARVVLELVTHILVMLFLLSILYYGTKLCITNSVRKFNTLPISYSFATVSAPIGAVLMMITGIGKLKKSIQQLLAPKNTDQ